MFVLFNHFSAFLALSTVLPTVFTFTFIPGEPTECDNLPISWTGGTPPFHLLLTPIFGTPENITIPASAFNSGSGSFSMLLQMQATAQFLLTMSDATGFNSGGTTPLLTVGASTGGSSCNTTTPGIAFSFQLNSALTQCMPFSFTGYTDAVQPVTIAAFIPGGSAFELYPPIGSTSFSWNANVIHGTSMIFSMTDAQGRQGGSSDVKIVGLSGDSTCLDSSSPSSTSAFPSPTTSTSPSPSSGPTASPSHGISIAAIAGTVIASLLFLAVVVTLGLFFLRKILDSQSSGKGNIRRMSRPLESEIDLSSDSRQTPTVTPYNVPRNHELGLAPLPHYPNSNPSFDANPFQDSPSQPTHYQIRPQYQQPGTFQSPSQYYPPVSGYPPQEPVTDSSMPSISRTEFEPPLTSSTSTSQQKKASIAGVKAYKPSRFVLHTDAEDNNDGVIELPPQYSEHRRMPGGTNLMPDSNAGHPPGNFHS